MEFQIDNYESTKIKNISERYIFFKDKKAMDNILDIEISLRGHQNIKAILVIDQNLPISVLKTKIPETLEKFHKLTNISYPKVMNLMIKRDKDKEIQLELESNLLIIDVIRIGDVLVFDLYFKEIWVEVSLSNEIMSKEKSLFFEIKVNLDCLLLNLTCILVNLLFKFFSLNITHVSNKEDFYLFASFQLSIEDDNGRKENLIFFDKNTSLSLSLSTDSNRLTSKENLIQNDDSQYFPPVKDRKISLTNKTNQMIFKTLREIVNIDSHLYCKASFVNLNILINDYMKLKNISLYKLSNIGEYISSFLSLSNFESNKKIIWRKNGQKKLNKENKEYTDFKSDHAFNWNSYIKSNISQGSDLFKLTKPNKDYQQNRKVDFILENTFSPRRESLLQSNNENRRISHIYSKNKISLPVNTLNLNTFIDIVNRNSCAFFPQTDLVLIDQWSIRNLKNERKDSSDSASSQHHQEFPKKPLFFTDFLMEVFILFVIVVLFLFSLLVIVYY